MAKLRTSKSVETLTLSELRERRRVSQAALASHMGKSQPAVHSVERSVDPQYETMSRYVAALGELVGEPADLQVRVTLGKKEYRILPAPRSDGGAFEPAARSRPSFAKASGPELAPDSTEDERLVAEVEEDDPEVVAAARRAVEDLVERTRAEGRKQVIVDHLSPLASYFDLWARHFGRPAERGVRFGGRSGEPGLWHALDGIHPLDPPDHWDRLRKAIVDHLLDSGSWERVGPSIRGSEFFIPGAGR